MIYKMNHLSGTVRAGNQYIMSQMVDYRVQLLSLTADHKYVRKRRSGAWLYKTLIEQVQKFTLCTFLLSMTWAACSFRFLEMWLLVAEEEAMKWRPGSPRRGAARSCESKGTEALLNSTEPVAVLTGFLLKWCSGEFCWVSVKLESAVCFWQDLIFWCNTMLLGAAISAPYFLHLFSGI